jgi:NADH-quinone oxidoreductase E subunit
MPYAAGFQQSDRKLPHAGEPFAFTPERRAEFEQRAAQYPPEQRKSAILYALFLVQDQIGYVSANAMRHVAEVIGCTPAEVEDVTSYYAMFFRQPTGTFVIQVCRTLSCALRGAERVTEELTHALGIPVGGTDASGTFTVVEAECLGACDRGPVLMINDRGWHENLKPEDATRLLEELRTRGTAALTGCHHKVEQE